MECKMHGSVPTDKVRALNELLKGMAGQPSSTFKVHEISMRAGTKPPVDLKLQRSLSSDATSYDCRWKVRHESLPMRGQAAEKLPASVRGVSESCCYGPKVVDFWMALGFRQEFQSIQDGVLYKINEGSHELLVRLMCLKKVPKGDVSAAKDLMPEFWLLEVSHVVSTDVPSQAEVLYADACRSINTFAGHVKEYAVLQKPKQR